MKRSQINKAIKNIMELTEKYCFKLPPFAQWSPKDWETKGSEYDEIRDAMLGWDVTDFGSGDFDKVGLALFTIRNGVFGSEEYTKPYAEKILVSNEEQYTPYHFHWNKQEDIINRGGGNLLIQLYNSTEDEEMDVVNDVVVSVDGVKRVVAPGSIIRLTPGESICLTQGLYHQFWAEKGYGPVLIGEVSMTNDDVADNRFLNPGERYMKIEEDELPIRLLCNEYKGGK